MLYYIPIHHYQIVLNIYGGSILKEIKLGLNEHTAMQNARLKDGKITESEWYESKSTATAESYTARETPWAQCGHGGTQETWMYSRIMPLLETINKSGSFIDVGCAVGYINESLHQWTKNSPFDITYYGVDICEPLIEIAKMRMPEFKDNYYIGNVDTWIPPVKFDYVRTLTIDFVPPYKRKEFIDNLFENYLKDDGRFIFGSYTEPIGQDTMADYLSELGYNPSGYIKKSYGDKERKLLWFDKK